MYNRTDALVKNKFKEHLPATVMTSLAMSLASVVDSMIVGNLLGDTALAAIGLSSPIIFHINLVYMLFGVGGLTCASIAKGERNSKRANQIFTFTIVGGLASMLAYALLVTLFLPQIGWVLTGGDTALAALTTAYIRPLVWTGPALLFSSGIALFLRIDGKPNSAARIVLIANAVNLICDYVLIQFLHAGIMGAGLSTTLGYVCGSVVVIPYLLSKKRTFRFVRIPKAEMALSKDVFLKGLPKSLNQATSCLRSFVLNAIILQSLGAIGLSIMVICTNIQMVAGIFINGTSDALLPIVGGLFGERDYFGIQKVAKSGFRVLIISCLTLMLAIIAAPQVVAGMFGLSAADSLDMVCLALRLFALYIPVYGATALLQNMYTATKREKFAIIIPTLDGAVFVLAFAMLFASINATWLWLCFVASGLCTFGVVLCIAVRIRKKEAVQGILLLKEVQETGVTWDLTLPAEQAHAVALSQQAIDFCTSAGVDKTFATRLGIALEEMAIYIAKHNQKQGDIDILIRILESEIIVRFRDDGEKFDPTLQASTPDVPDTLPDFNELEMVQKITSNVDYIQQMGFNSTILTIQMAEVH